MVARRDLSSNLLQAPHPTQKVSKTHASPRLTGPPIVSFAQPRVQSTLCPHNSDIQQTPNTGFPMTNSNATTSTHQNGGNKDGSDGQWGENGPKTSGIAWALGMFYFILFHIFSKLINSFYFIYVINWRRWFGWVATTITGPNNASGVAWVLFGL